MIKSGGWATGGNYRYYRDRGWGPAGALFMITPTIIWLLICILVGLLGGWVLSCFAAGGM